MNDETAKGETMETKKLEWGSSGNSVRIAGTVDRPLQGADASIVRILSAQNIPMPRDWDRVYPYSATITDEILGAIREDRAAAVAAIEARHARPAKHCTACGRTDVMFTTGGGGGVCDDCF